MKRYIIVSLFLITAHPPLFAQWNLISELQGRPIVTILVRDSLIFAGGHGNTLFRSTDNGVSWTNIAGIIDADTILSLGADSIYIFVGTSRQTYRSSDYGVNISSSTEDRCSQELSSVFIAAQISD